MFIIPPFYSSDDQLIIRRAHAHATTKHQGQNRIGGDPYIVHPESVAKVLMDLPAKAEVVAAGFLHDVLEDTDETFKGMVSLFGFDIAKIVNAVTKTKKLERIKKAHPDEKRKLLHHQFLDTIKDVRAAVVKVADRLHNCRTFEVFSHEKQVEIANETIRMYIPLARQIGLNAIELELSSLCLDVLTKEEYQIAVKESSKYEDEILIKGYHQNKLDLCLLI